MLQSPIDVSAPRTKKSNEEIKNEFCTRNRSAQSNKSDSIDGVFEVNEASKMASNITNDGSTDTNHGNGDNEAGVSSTQS